MIARCISCPRFISRGVRCVDCRKRGQDAEWLLDVRASIRPLLPLAMVLRALIVRSIPADGGAR